MISELSSAVYVVKYGFGTKFRLSLVGSGFIHNHLFAVPLVGPEVFALSALVVFNKLVGAGENILGRAVVLLKPYNVGLSIAGKVSSKDRIFSMVAPLNL